MATVIQIGGTHFELLDDPAVEVAKILAGATPVNSNYNGTFTETNKHTISIDFNVTVNFLPKDTDNV